MRHERMSDSATGRRRLLWSVLTAVAALLALACDDCRKTSECGVGEVCRAGECRAQGTPDETDSSIPTEFPWPSDTATTDTETLGTETSSVTPTDSDTSTGERPCKDPSLDCPEPDPTCGRYECSIDAKCLLVSIVDHNTPCGAGAGECGSHVCRSGVCETVPLNEGLSCASDSTDPCIRKVCSAGACGAPAVGQQCPGDGDPCKEYVCDAKGTCAGTARPDGASCEDGLWCTGSNTCQGGACSLDEAPCQAPDHCQSRECFEPEPSQLEGTCGQLVASSGVACDNGLYCDGADQCYEGLCVPGAGVCTGTSACSEAGCDDAKDECVSTNLPNGQSCADALLCNGSEVCESGGCTAGFPACKTYNNCQTEICDESLGYADCTSTIVEDGALCNVGDPCSGIGEHLCLEGNCTYAETPACAPNWGDANYCTIIGSCGQATGGGADCRLPYTVDDYLPALRLGCVLDEANGVDTTVAFSTAHAVNEVSSYSGCPGNFTGGDMLIEVVAPAGTGYTATLSIASETAKGGLALLVITNPCDADGTCVAGPAFEVDATMPVSGRHLLVVDGLDGARGRGTVSLACH